MPGLKELQLGAQRVKVSYFNLPEGAEIRFETTDPHLLTVIHRWFCLLFPAGLKIRC